jgi:hypothetical protein
LPTSHDCIVHWSFHVRSPHRLERFTLVPYNTTKLLHRCDIDCDLRTSESVSDVKTRKDGLVSKPELPVEHLDTRITIFNYLVDWEEAHRRFVLKLQAEWNRDVLAFFANGEVDQLRCDVVLDLNRSETGVIGAPASSGAIYSMRGW